MMFSNPNKMPPDEQMLYYKRLIGEIAKVIFFGVILLGFYSSCYQPHRIPSGSMIPSLMIGDYILVDKSAYGLRLPFSESFNGGIFLNEKSDPKRGDIVVFKYPENPRLNYIKRVIGLPGDVVEMRDNRWIINNVPEEIHGPFEILDPHQEIEDRFLEQDIVEYHSILDDREYRFFKKRDENNPSNIGQVVLGPDEFFMSGDNRDFSEDSRHWGSVHRSLIRGKAILVWLNLTSPFSKQGFRSKSKRIGTRLD
jgi:signal peptidase I